MTPSQPISEAAYPIFLKTFQAFNDSASLMQSELIDSPLVAQIVAHNPGMLQPQALRQVFSEILALLAAENADYADLLQGRFWEGKQIEEMVTAQRPQPLSKRTFSNYQRSAILAFAFLFTQAEANSVPIQAQEKPTAPRPALESIADGSQERNVNVGATDGQSTVRWRWWVGLALGLVLLGALVTRWMQTNRGETLLFADDFEQGMNKWRVDDPAWQVRAEGTSNQALCVKTSGNYIYAMTGSTTWRDYALQLDVKILQSAPNGSGNILWRVAEDFYPFYVFDFFAAESAGANLATEVGGESSYQVLDQTLQGLPTGEWIPIRIVSTGAQLQLYTDQESVPLLQGSDPRPIVQGGIGLGAGFAEGESDGVWEICFDNVRVTTTGS